ncbi:unnamed protein product [Trichogramma brassicae]|uniref:Uncharacterized protein n=1 Tax=Trichogramma brassicae TaxID=86971 RepID=A0A6H5J6I1_9HYME|nr:unnamed protein product [Trichogramma brassicae]
MLRNFENPPRNCFWPFAWVSGKLVLKMFTVPGDITRCVLGSRLPNIRVLRPRRPPEKLLLAFRVGIRQVGPEEDVHSTRRYHQVRPRLSPTQYSCSPTSKTPREKLLLAFRMGIRQVGPGEDVHSTRRYHQVRPRLSPTQYSCSPTSKTPRETASGLSHGYPASWSWRRCSQYPEISPGAS